MTVNPALSERYFPQVPPGANGMPNLQALNEIIRQLFNAIYAIEGRQGGTSLLANVDIAGNLSVDGTTSIDGAISGASLAIPEKVSAASTPTADGVVLYAVDNGSGKTQLMAQFKTGSAQQVAIEP